MGFFGTKKEVDGDPRDRPAEKTGMDEEYMEWVELDDVNVVAFLHCRGMEFRTFKGEDGRVMFMVHGSNIDRKIREFYEGYKVNVSQYVKSMKFVKGNMYSLKHRDRNDIED